MPDANMFVEKRAHPRVKLNISAKYRLLEDKKEIESVIGDQKKEMFSLARDISLSGMGITTDQPLKDGDILNFEITLPDRPGPLSALAEVIWTIDKNAGLHFLKMSDENLSILKEYLHKY